MMTPFTKPIIAPHKSAAATPAHKLSVKLMTMALSTPANATIDPTDRSKSRDAKQNIIVQATIPICDTDSASPSMFWTVKKYRTENARATKMTRNMTTRLYFSRKASTCRQGESERCGGEATLGPELVSVFTINFRPPGHQAAPD